MRYAVLAAAILAAGCGMNPALRTRAERTEFRETSRLDDIRENLRALARHPWIRTIPFGQSAEGREIPAFVISGRGAFSPEEARRWQTPVVLVLANIHGGEVCGKEASIMLAREICYGDLGHLARDLTIVVVPVFNADGNERISPENRRLDLEKLEGQVGPEGGVGIRHTAEGYDLNRDYIAQRAVEMRHLTRLYTYWWPHLTIDLHTTNGSQHGYHLTYDTPRHPAAHPAPVEYVRTRLLPEVSRRLETRTGYRTFFYGNFRDNDPSHGWETYPALPRFGSHYRGLTGRMDILSEAYSYIPFRDRVLVTFEFLREILEYVREHAGEILRVCAQAEKDARRGAPEQIALRHEIVAEEAPVTILGSGGERYENVPHFARSRALHVVARPWAYALEPSCAEAIRSLELHGIRIRRLVRPVAAEVEEYVVEGIEHIQRSAYVNPAQKSETQLRVRRRRGRALLEAGSAIVRADQPLGTLACFLLEPESEDGLVAWNFFDAHVRTGAPFPVRRLAEPQELPLDQEPPPPPRSTNDQKSAFSSGGK